MKIHQFNTLLNWCQIRSPFYMNYLSKKPVFFIIYARKYMSKITGFPLKNTSFTTVKSLHYYEYYKRIHLKNTESTPTIQTQCAVISGCLFLSKLVSTVNKDKVFFMP